MTTRPDPRDFRKRLLAREPLIGTFMKFTTPMPTEVLGSIGYDFVMLDEEHSPWTREHVGVGLLAARAFGIAGFVRVSRPDAASILSMLDDGATGVMVPHVDSAQKAADVASWSRYIGGTRGSGNSRGGDYGARNGNAHYEYSDEHAAVIAMIEDAAAIERIDEITAVEGIDCFFMGRGDLALSLSNVKGPKPTLDEAVKIIAESVLKSGKALAAVAPSMTSDDAKKMKDIGVSALMVSSDINLLKAAAANELKGFKALYGA